ncbi:hypothetical protein CPB84DRAFT_1845628 [Gymnopilus junonius]|uniref:Uncharacterized protein n=1 Tax=Gymnopilus junonius TaxID=109634 RepID=A0A9P5NU72_GYMJU|nr:hypothetical protein CPB84DRAFT_1845628 [Gymnopilus junonius]
MLVAQEHQVYKGPHLPDPPNGGSGSSGGTDDNLSTDVPVKDEDRLLPKTRKKWIRREVEALSTGVDGRAGAHSGSVSGGVGRHKRDGIFVCCYFWEGGIQIEDNLSYGQDVQSQREVEEAIAMRLLALSTSATLSKKSSSSAMPPRHTQRRPSPPNVIHWSRPPQPTLAAQSGEARNARRAGAWWQEPSKDMFVTRPRLSTYGQAA